MKLLEMTQDFDKGDQGDRALFEAAMVKRIEEQGMNLMDLCYDVYCTQKNIHYLGLRVSSLIDRLEDVESELDEKPAPKSKKK